MTEERQEPFWGGVHLVQSIRKELKNRANRYLFKADS